MTSENRSPLTRWLQIILIVMILLSVFFRFSGLENKIYWHDEAYTSLWISGYSRPDAAEALYQGQLVTMDTVQTYQHLAPDTSVVDAVGNLAEYNTQHPPLFYSLARLWAETFGDSILSLRFFSVLLSLIALPFAYWLGLELFGSTFFAGVFLALICLSPFHLLYAQEARQYGLWTGMILFNHAALLRSVRKPSRWSWLTYFISLVIGLYTFLFTALVMFSHGAYLLITERFRFTPSLKSYASVSLLSLLAFSPWLVELFSSSDPVEGVSWTSNPVPLDVLVRSWGINISRLFFDVGLQPDGVILGLIAVILGYTLFSLRNSSLRVGAFILMTGALPALCLLLPDLTVGGIRSIVARYLIPTWLSLQLMVAYYIGSVVMTKSSPHILIQRVLILFLFIGSLLSCAVIPQASNGWIKGISQHQPRTLELINQAERPLVINDYSALNLGEILSMSHRLDPKVRLLLVREPELPDLPRGFSDIFVFNPSTDLREEIEQEHIPLESVYREGTLWRIPQS